MSKTIRLHMQAIKYPKDIEKNEKYSWFRDLFGKSIESEISWHVFNSLDKFMDDDIVSKIHEIEVTIGVNRI